MEYREFKRAYLNKNTGQAPKPLITRKRKVKKPVPASWPRTGNQKAQSRPVIIINPVRALKARLRDEALYGWQVRDLIDSVKNQPKHLLDLGT